MVMTQTQSSVLSVAAYVVTLGVVIVITTQAAETHEAGMCPWRRILLRFRLDIIWEATRLWPMESKR